MSHLVSGINSLLLSDSLVPVSILDSDLPTQYACQFNSFHKFTIFIIHNYTLSLQAQNLCLPLSQILSTIGPLFLPDWHNGRWLSWLLTVFVLVPCGRLSWFLLAFDCTLISHPAYHFSRPFIGSKMVDFNCRWFFTDRVSTGGNAIASIRPSSVSTLSFETSV